MCCRNIWATDLMLVLTFASSEDEVQQKSSALADNATESERKSESKTLNSCHVMDGTSACFGDSGSLFLLLRFRCGSYVPVTTKSETSRHCL